MKKYLASLADESGSALLVVVLLVPVITLFCLFASTVSFQNQTVTTNDNCHRDGLYNADGAIYGTAKLISLIGKSKTREPVKEGAGNDAPGIEYLNSASDKAEYFRHLLTSRESEKTTEDLKFVQPDSTNDFGVESTVHLLKFPGGNPAGGGAEFGNAAEGIGSQVNVVIFRMTSTGQSSCPNTDVQTVGDYWMIVTDEGQTKGI